MFWCNLNFKICVRFAAAVISDSKHLGVTGLTLPQKENELLNWGMGIVHLTADLGV